MDLRRPVLLAAALLAFPPAFAAPPKKADPGRKQAVVASVDRHRGELVSLADQVWGVAETALRETRSAKVLADFAEQQGFQVERGVAGLPMAFTARVVVPGRGPGIEIGRRHRRFGRSRAPYQQERGRPSRCSAT